MLKARIYTEKKDLDDFLHHPSTARNSYITTLTFHGISDAFIDSMVGHVNSKNILRGYQGTISPKRRMKINSILFEDPEIEDDND